MELIYVIIYLLAIVVVVLVVVVVGSGVVVVGSGVVVVITGVVVVLVIGSCDVEDTEKFQVSKMRYFFLLNEIFCDISFHSL